MPNDPQPIGMHALLSEEGLGELIKDLTARYHSWAEFSARPLPSQLKHDALWELLKLLFRAGGIEVPIPDLEGNEYWYHRTHELADMVAAIQCLCRGDSDLYRNLTMIQNRSVLVQSRIDETIAAASLDGLEISKADVQGMLQLDRVPRNNTERLVRNTLTALDDLPHLIDVPFSKELFWHLRYLLLEGVDVRGINVRSPRLGLIAPVYDNQDTQRVADRQLEFISAYLNHTTGEVHDHAVLRALLLPDLFRFYRPLPDSNSEVGRLAFRLYALKAGLPVLGMLPLSRAKLDWEEERHQHGSTVTLPPAAYHAARDHDGTDLTAYYTLSVQLALVALQDLSYKLRKLQERDEELRALLQRDPEINHRQRSILGRALRDPTAEFRIAYHKNTHNVVYATARADLLELAEKGFLEIGKSGRAMVFTPREGLREYIEQAYGDSQDS
jgi:Fic family protein